MLINVWVGKVSFPPIAAEACVQQIPPLFFQVTVSGLYWHVLFFPPILRVHEEKTADRLSLGYGDYERLSHSLPRSYEYTRKTVDAFPPACWLNRSWQYEAARERRVVRDCIVAVRRSSPLLGSSASWHADGTGITKHGSGACRNHVAITASAAADPEWPRMRARQAAWLSMAQTKSGASSAAKCCAPVKTGQKLHSAHLSRLDANQPHKN